MPINFVESYFISQYSNIIIKRSKLHSVTKPAFFFFLNILFLFGNFTHCTSITLTSRSFQVYLPSPVLFPPPKKEGKNVLSPIEVAHTFTGARSDS